MVMIVKILLVLMTGLLLISLAMNGYQYHYAQQQNALIQQPDTIAADQNTDLKVQFARAYYLAQQQDYLTAMALYNQIANQAQAKQQTTLWEDSQYNIGLLYLQQAIIAQQASAKGQHAQFAALLELASSEFKILLRQNPAHYAARLSLEQTLSLLPPDSLSKAGWKEQRTSTFSHVAGVAKGGP